MKRNHILIFILTVAFITLTVTGVPDILKAAAESTEDLAKEAQNPIANLSVCRYRTILTLVSGRITVCRMCSIFNRWCRSN